MKGFPNYINTRADLENLKEGFPFQTRAFMQEIYDFRHQWIVTGKLEADEPGIVLEGKFKVVENDSTEHGGGVGRYQYEFMEDPNGTIFRLGFASSDEFLAFIQSI